MLTLDRQESYRRRYAAQNEGWRPASHLYRDRVASLLTPTTHWLDLGCGRGGVVEELHTGQVVGADPHYASLYAHRLPGLARVCAPAERLPWPEATFDLVCCSWVLEHLGHPARAFAEVARVLKPGGRFVFLTPNARHPLLALNRLLRGGRLVAWLYDRAAADTFPALYRANTPERIHDLLRQAGLEVVTILLVGDPTYLAFGETAFRLACGLERLTPPSWRVHILGEAQLKPNMG